MDIQTIVLKAREQNKDIDISSFIEITEDMPLNDAIWYYNTFPAKRNEIEKVFFKRYKNFQEWYAVYKAADKTGAISEHCLSKIKETLHTIDEALEVYDVDFSDEVLRKLVLGVILDIAEEDFSEWLHIYDESLFDKELNKIALKKIITLAKTKDDYKEIYDRSDIGSSIQLDMIEKLYGKIEIKSEEISHVKYEKRDQKEYMELYEKEQFGSIKRDNLLVSRYFAADREAAGETGSNDEVIDNP